MSDVSERWKRLEALFDEALALDEAQRDAWLAALDVDDDTRRELAGMLAADRAAAAESLATQFGDAIASAAEVPVPGERVGPFRLLREIGSGGVGVVFLAERADDEFHQEVAIKVIRGVATGDAVRQLRHERQILAGFDHPNIARLLDGGATRGGHPYLAMEFIRGAPITEACEKRNVPLKARIALLAEVARAVHYAHQRLVIHRDIKPTNVLLRDDGRPVLLDFGIAKLLDEKAQRERLATQPWFTPAYAAPEQRRGGTVSTATDVYALGLLLFELLTDQRPILDVDQRVLAPSLAAPEFRRATIRGDLDRIVALATQEEPGDRYPSAESFARDLDRYLAGQPVRAAPDRASYKLRKFVQRHRFGVAAGFAGVVLLSLAGARLVVERNRALAAEARAAREIVAADAVSAFLVDLFRQAESGAERKRALTPVDIVDRGSARMRERADLAAAQRARLAGVLGRIYTHLGEPGKAHETLTYALAAAREAGVGPVELANHLGELATANTDRGDHAAAVANYREALELARAAGDRAIEIDVLLGLGSTLVRTDEIAAGEAVLEDAIALGKRVYGPDTVVVAKGESYLAEAWAATGRREQAAKLMDRAIATMRARLPPDDYQLLRAYSRYGSLLLALGEPKRAEEVVLELQKQRASLAVRDSSLLANSYMALGAVYYNQGRAVEATGQVSQALELAERTLDDGDVQLAAYRNSLGVILAERGAYARAAQLIGRALATLEAAPERNALTIVKYRQNLGVPLMRGGRAEEALRVLSLPVGEGEDGDWALNRQLQRLSLAEWHLRHGTPAEASKLLDDAELHIDDAGGAGGNRYGQLLRLRALLQARADAKSDAGWSTLLRAHEVMAAARGRDSIAAGEVALDLAELARARGDEAAATKWSEEARRVLVPALVEDAPQHARLAALARG